MGETFRHQRKKNNKSGMQQHPKLSTTKTSTTTPSTTTTMNHQSLFRFDNLRCLRNDCMGVKRPNNTGCLQESARRLHITNQGNHRTQHHRQNNNNDHNDRATSGRIKPSARHSSSHLARLCFRNITSHSDQRQKKEKNSRLRCRSTGLRTPLVRKTPWHGGTPTPTCAAERKVEAAAADGQAEEKRTAKVTQLGPHSSGRQSTPAETPATITPRTETSIKRSTSGSTSSSSSSSNDVQ